MNICLECKIDTKNPKFCSNSCAAIYNNKNRVDKCPGKNDQKNVNCIICNLTCMVNKRSRNRVICLNCKRKLAEYQKDQRAKIHIQPRLNICKTCGSDNCKKISICKGNGQILKSLTKYFGFNISVIGTDLVFKEFERIRSTIIDKYDVDKLSLTDLCKEYNHPDIRNFNKILNSIGVRKRGLSESIQNSIFRGKNRVISQRSNYKHGWHKTWEGRDIFYRSSYELEYAKQLDECKIRYDVENLRIEYWDSQEQKYRIAIPDFHLTDLNIIVEIKSKYFYDAQNMKDKFQKYIDLGYNCKLVLDGVETLVN